MSGRDTITVVEDGSTYTATCSRCREQLRADTEATAVQRAREHAAQHGEGEIAGITVREADGTERAVPFA